MAKIFTKEDAKRILECGFNEAKTTLGDKNKTKKLIDQIEEKLKGIDIKEGMENLKLLIDCFKSYVKGEYKEIPIMSMIAVVSALLYWVNPFDIIPDVIPIVGQLDDMAVVLVCWELVKTDLDEYKKWRDAQ